MYAGLSPGAIGVSAPNLHAALEAARMGGFDGVEFNPAEIADLIDAEGAAQAKARFEAAGIKPCGFGLSVEWRGEEDAFRASLARFPRLVEAAAAVGATRCSTWILPFSNELEFDANFAFHIARLEDAVRILGDHGILFGLEFIGPKTLRDQGKHPFIHTQDGMMELAQKLGPNAGLLLDAWHWYTSHGTVDDLLRLKPENIAYVHVNDAPVGVEIDEQVDNVRCLPGETGVIPISDFMGALKQIGYDGPIVAEPFKKELSDLPDDAARLTAVRDSLRKIGV
jgi:sugar phosphate isomerase/epimerase